MGPEIAVLLRRELARHEVLQIPGVLRSEAGIVPLGCPEDSTDCSVSVGVYCHALVRTDCFWVRLITSMGDGARVGRPPIEAAIGWSPSQAIWMDAGRNDRLSHKVLGRAVAALADRFDGIVDLYGAISPPVPPSRLKLPEQDWHSLEEISRFVHRFPGEVHELYSVNEDGLIRLQHFVDAEFMRSWLNWPSFHLVTRHLGVGQTLPFRGG